MDNRPPKKTTGQTGRARVLRRATEVLGTQSAAQEWLNTPQRALGEKRPAELLSSADGVEAVLNLLGGIEDGGYL